MFLGAHFSIAGGPWRACEEAAELGCNTLQMFTKNQMQWAAKPIPDEDAARFRQAREKLGIRFAFAHDSYLINLASTADALFARSVKAFIEEIERAEGLGLDFLVTHPGSAGEAGIDAGIARMRCGLRDALRACRGVRVQVLVETMAGQGNVVGRTFEEMARLVDESDRLGVCFDTCHVFAAGYDLRTEDGYGHTMDEFDRLVGVDRIRAFHLNDSKKGLGSRVDRHEHIGRGRLGRTAFRCVMTDPRFQDAPKVIETPKVDDMDRKNLAVLRKLAEGAPCRK
jgi:deoxyribonuclease-4